MNQLNISVINRSENPLPAYQTGGSAGMDLAAWLPAGEIIMAPLERKLVPTGLFLSIPAGFEAQIRPRSGMAFKKGLTVVNAPGTIDSDYRGEIMVAMINLSQEAQTIQSGDRIAQMILAKHETVLWTETSSLETTERSAGGFGHTG